MTDAQATTMIGLLVEIRDALCGYETEADEVPEPNCPCAKLRGAPIENCPLCKGTGVR